MVEHSIILNNQPLYLCFLFTSLLFFLSIGTDELLHLHGFFVRIKNSCVCVCFMIGELVHYLKYGL